MLSVISANDRLHMSRKRRQWFTIGKLSRGRAKPEDYSHSIVAGGLLLTS